MRYSNCVACCLILSLSASLTCAQVTVVDDDFDSGLFSVDWDSVSGSGTAILPGGPVGSTNYARIEGVTSSQGGLGVTLAGLSAGSPFSTDFSTTFDFRVDNTTNRQFNFQVSSSASSPNTSQATINLRYQSGGWDAFNGGSWQSIGGLGSVTPNTWNSITITGNNWGTGVPGTSDYDISFTDHLGSNSLASGLQIFHQGDPDSGGAKSLNFNDTWGSNPGWDIDNVSVTATPAASGPTTVVITPTNPVAYSGIYAHTAVTNTHNESAVGALLNRGGKVWFVTYGPHLTTGSSDKLYSVDTTTLEHTTYLEHPGNTDANRYTDTNLGLDFIGAAYIDSSDNIRYLPVTSPGAGHAVGRFTGTAAHLTDPNKIYYMTMEEGLYEVDYSDLDNPVITTLRQDGNHGGSKNLPGVHGKGLFTGQNHLYFTNNGAGGGAEGGLVEWDGTGNPEDLSAWTIVDDTAQYTEVTSRNGPVDMDPASSEAIWATGWDDESMFINTRDATTGDWTKFRMPKSSYTHGHPNGWYTEWPRIRDVGLAGGYLMSHHGMMFLVPDTFSKDNYGGVTPVTAHHKMIVDYVEEGNQLILAGNDASRFSNSLVPKANSNIQFIDKSSLADYGGKPRGYGGVWVDDSVPANTESDAFLISGFANRVVHFAHNSGSSVDYTIEVDENGDGTWTTHSVVTIPGTGGPNEGYGHYIIPDTLSAQWVRFKANQSVTSTVYLHQGNEDLAENPMQFASLADTSAPAARSQGLIRSRGEADYKLEFAADRLDANGNLIGQSYYQAQLNPTTSVLELVAVNDSGAETAMRNDAATSQDFGVDVASVFIDDGGTRFRFPKGADEFDSATVSGARRGMREVVTERELMNIHGTFYELPRNFTGGGIRRVLPVTTHNLDIFDFASWRGMLVLSGVEDGGAVDGHYLESDDGEVGLWFGNVDDLWSFGAPEGVGGPWKETAVTAGTASDPYLMAGYNDKVLQLSHEEASTVNFTVEVDFLGTNDWHVYDTFSVDPGEVLTHVFDEAYSAHWVRLVSDTSTTATSWFIYGEDPLAINADFDGDGIVGGLDFLTWQANRGQTGQTDNSSGDASGNGVVDDYDLQLLFSRYGQAVTLSAATTQVPEPTTIVLLSAGLLLCTGTHRRHRLAHVG